MLLLFLIFSREFVTDLGGSIPSLQFDVSALELGQSPRLDIVLDLTLRFLAEMTFCLELARALPGLSLQLEARSVDPMFSLELDLRLELIDREEEDSSDCLEEEEERKDDLEAEEDNSDCLDEEDERRELLEAEEEEFSDCLEEEDERMKGLDVEDASGCLEAEEERREDLGTTEDISD